MEEPFDDGASSVPNGDPSMNNPEIGGQMPQQGPGNDFQNEPEGGMPQDQMGMPNDGGDMMNGQDMGMEGGPEGDKIASITSTCEQLSDTDLDAVKGYAESMLSRDENSNDDMNNAGGMMSESRRYRDVVFKKRQLNEINENFGPTADELERTAPKPFSKKVKKQKNDTPFNKPKFS